MALSGSYLDSDIRGARIIGPVMDFSECVFRDVLPAFGNLDERAEQVASDYYSRVGSQPAGEYESVDMADVAEAAHDHSLNWYQTMTSVRQSMRNLLAAGLFHVAEQQLAESCRDASYHVDPPADTKLSVVRSWYREHYRLELSSLPSWAVFDELRLVANAVKHGEGPATRRLREIRPELFSNPDHAEIYQGLGIPPPVGTTALAPLSGEDLYVSEGLLRMYSESAESFFREIAAHFASKPDTWYPF